MAESGPVRASDERVDRGVLASATLLAAALAAGELSVPNDLFWHLAIARRITEHGFPRTDPFGFGTDQIAWSPPEWLGELVFAAAYDALGYAGTTLLTVVAIAACFGAVVSAARTSASPVAAAMAVSALAWPAAVHLPMRPLVLGDVCFTFLLARLFALRAGDARGLAALPLLFVAWTNLHPSWPVGLALLWIHAATLAWLRGPASRIGLVVEPLRPEARRPLAIAVIGSTLAVLARPDGLDGALYPFVHVVGLGDRMREIIEWFAPDLGQPVNLALLVLLALTLIVWMAARPDVRLLDGVLLAIGTGMALRYQRFLPIAAFTAAPVLARGLARTRLASVTLSRSSVRGALALAALVLLLRLPTPHELAEDVAASYPEQAVRWTEAHGLPGRAFNTFEDGGYLLFRLPHRQVLIDSRFDLYARCGLFDDYLALRRGERIAEIFERYGIDAAFVPTPARDENFARLEAALPGLGFTLVHEDPATHLWARQTIETPSLHP